MNQTRSRVRERNKASEAPPGRHFDNAGHLVPERAARLLEQSGRGQPPAQEAFVSATAADDDLAAELGEGAVVAMTSGEDIVVEHFNLDVEEDLGGPFVETSASKEFASGTDESNIAEATREPFPTV